MNKNKDYESPFVFLRNDVRKLEITNDFIIPSDKNIDRNFKIDYEILDVFEVENKRVGIIELVVEMCLKNEKEELINFKIAIDGQFYADKEHYNVEQFNNMLELNGLTALYGIARGQITSISSIAFANEVIRLPMLNIQKFVESKHLSSK